MDVGRSVGGPDGSGPAEPEWQEDVSIAFRNVGIDRTVMRPREGSTHLCNGYRRSKERTIAGGSMAAARADAERIVLH